MRMTFLVSLFGLFAVALTPVTAQLSDVEIKVTREKLAQDVNNRGNKRIEQKEVQYNITVQSKTFKQLSNLEAKYMVFYYEAAPGSPDKPEEKSVTGTEKITAIASNRSTSFDTKPVTLTTVTLDAGWYYYGGASNKSRDRVAGIWVKVFNESGEVIGEYANPAGMTKRIWKD